MLLKLCFSLIFSSFLKQDHCFSKWFLLHNLNVKHVIGPIYFHGFVFQPKPLSNQFFIQVGDFGLSKIKRNTLVTGGVRGTLPWMAPELLNGSSSKVSEKVRSCWLYFIYTSIKGRSCLY